MRTRQSTLTLHLGTGGEFIKKEGAIGGSRGTSGMTYLHGGQVRPVGRIAE
jgi:hypothetical protein